MKKWMKLFRKQQGFSFHIDDIDIDENHGNKVMQKALDFLYSWLISEGVRKQLRATNILVVYFAHLHVKTLMIQNWKSLWSMININGPGTIIRRLNIFFFIKRGRILQSLWEHIVSSGVSPPPTPPTRKTLPHPLLVQATLVCVCLIVINFSNAMGFVTTHYSSKLHLWLRFFSPLYLRFFH